MIKVKEGIRSNYQRRKNKMKKELKAPLTEIEEEESVISTVNDIERRKKDALEEVLKVEAHKEAAERL